VVYDIIQQILNGHKASGFNRELIIDLFNEARLVRRILDANQHDNTSRWVFPSTIVFTPLILPHAFIARDISVLDTWAIYF
jgi:hypothetical protein